MEEKIKMAVASAKGLATIVKEVHESYQNLMNTSNLFDRQISLNLLQMYQKLELAQNHGDMALITNVVANIAGKG